MKTSIFFTAVAATFVAAAPIEQRDIVGSVVGTLDGNLGGNDLNGNGNFNKRQVLGSILGSGDGNRTSQYNMIHAHSSHTN